MNKPRLASKKNCTGCLACADTCHLDALSSYIADDGHLYVKCNTNLCVACGLCEKVCPIVNGVNYSSNSVVASQPYSAFCLDENIYKASTSGGVFATLALNFIKKGGYVSAAILENNRVSHIVSNNPDDVKRMQGSKYMQSNTKGVYCQIEKLISKGEKVLFCGMGCQCAALISLFQKRKNRENLYVIDMVCGGVPSSLLVEKFIQNENTVVNIISFRQKREYILRCTNNAGVEVLLNRRTLPLVGYGSGFVNRYSCGDCHFCGVERLSDLTIGDLWGNSNKDNIHKSVVITHSKKGENLLVSTSLLEVKPISWEFIAYNYRCVIGKTIKGHLLQRKMLAWNFKHLPYKSLCGVYGCNLSNPFWFIFKIFNIAITRIDHFFIKKKLKTIIHSLKSKG